VVHPEPEVNLLELFILESTTPGFTSLIDYPVKFIALVQFTDLYGIKEALTSSHEVAVIFIIAFLTIAVVF
jgi:hypothetical protein